MYGHRRDQKYGFFANNEKDSSFEIYSPPYLFRGDRPEIEFAPSGVAWGSNFDVTMKGSDEIDSIALIRTGSPSTASTPTSARRAPVQAGRQQAHGHRAAERHVAPPGYYMLFVNKKSPKGPIPSVAAMVRVGDLISPQALTTPAAIPMQDSTAAASNGSATPDEDSSMNDFGECTGCAKEERGGARERTAAVEPGAAAGADLALRTTTRSRGRTPVRRRAPTPG